MNFAKTKTGRFVYTINSQHTEQFGATSNLEKNPTLSGILRIDKSPENNFGEEVKVVISLRKLTKLTPLINWSQIIHKQQPTTVEKQEFTIDKSVWLGGKGINWVIPTHLFGDTSVQIELNCSALLSTGFVIEVYRRDSTIIHEVPPSATITVGCTINFNINWNLSTNPARSTPVVTPARWSFPSPETEQTLLSASQRSINSGQSFFMHQCGISSGDDV